MTQLPRDPESAPGLAEERARRHARQQAEKARALRFHQAQEIGELLRAETRAIFEARADLGRLGARPEEGVPPSLRERLAVLAAAPALGVVTALAGGHDGVSVGGFVAGSVLGLGLVGGADLLTIQWAMQVRDDSDEPPSAMLPAVLAVTAAAGVGCLAQVFTASPVAAAAAALLAAAILGLVVMRAHRLARSRHAHRLQPRLKARHEQTLEQHQANVRQLQAELGPLMTDAAEASASALEARDAVQG